MRKLLGFILFLVLLGYPLIPVHAAELTVTERELQSCGNFFCEMGTITSKASPDTIPTRLSKVFMFIMTPTSQTAASSGLGATTLPIDQADYGYSVSGNVVTVYPETNDITWRYYAIGQ